MKPYKKVKTFKVSDISNLTLDQLFQKVDSLKEDYGKDARLVYNYDFNDYTAGTFSIIVEVTENDKLS